MPSVEYNCRNCGHSFKRLVFLDDKEEKPLCPECKSPDVEKSLTAASLFKGISSLSSLAGDTN